VRDFGVIKEKCSLSEALQVFHFKGNLNADRVHEIEESFAGALADNQNFIVAEMSEVDFISSPVLGELMGCKRRLTERGGNLYLVGLNTENRNKLRLMGAEKIFEFLPTIRSAVLKYRWENEDKGDEITVTIPPALNFVPEMRSLFSGVALQKGYSKRDAFRIETIIDELCNNAVEHGARTPPQPVQVVCRIFRFHLEFSIINRNAATGGDGVAEIQKRISGGAPFDLNERRGRGIELVKMLCAEFSVSSENDKTIVKVIKKKEV